VAVVQVGMASQEPQADTLSVCLKLCKTVLTLLVLLLVVVVQVHIIQAPVTTELPAHLVHIALHQQDMAQIDTTNIMVD
jgi:hypothetical protein